MYPEMHDMGDDEAAELLAQEFDDDVPAALSLTADQRSALAATVTRGLEEGSCDNTLRFAQQYAAGAGLAWPPLRDELKDNGGYCDCEVLFNVVGEADVGEPD